MRLLKLTFLLAAVSAAPAIDDDGSIENHCALDYNATSPFVKIVRTTDVKVRDVIYETPASVFIGKLNGDLLRCLQSDMNQCEVFYKTEHEINSMVLHMEYLYVADAKHVLKCESQRKQNCRTLVKISDARVVIHALDVGENNLYVGLSNGTILVSKLRRPAIYRTLHTLTNKNIWSLKQFDNYIYIGLDNGELMRCSLIAENRCTLMHNTTSTICGLISIGNTIVGPTFSDGLLWNCSQKSNATSDYCVSSASSNITEARALALFNSDLYVLRQEKSIHVCYFHDFKCLKYAEHGGLSMAFVYGTYQMQERYRNENRACTWQSRSKCPPHVAYFDVEQRLAMEVHVKDNRLYNSEGDLVDTTDADLGHSGPAAIFVMEPDGRILLSNSHKKYLLHTSSLSAGRPVAGAGEMVVEQGKIKNLTACSEHYRPDLQLNSQVVQSLRSQGYTEPIEPELCVDENQCESTNW